MCDHNLRERGQEGKDKDKDEDNTVPLNVLMTDARGDKDGTGVGCTSLNGERDPNGKGD